jgi:hypothetical protein
MRRALMFLLMLFSITLGQTNTVQTLERALDSVLIYSPVNIESPVAEGQFERFHIRKTLDSLNKEYAVNGLRKENLVLDSLREVNQTPAHQPYLKAWVQRRILPGMTVPKSDAEKLFSSIGAF